MSGTYGSPAVYHSEELLRSFFLSLKSGGSLILRQLFWDEDDAGVVSNLMIKNIKGMPSLGNLTTLKSFSSLATDIGFGTIDVETTEDVNSETFLNGIFAPWIKSSSLYKNGELNSDSAFKTMMDDINSYVPRAKIRTLRLSKPTQYKRDDTPAQTVLQTESPSCCKMRASKASCGPDPTAGGAAIPRTCCRNRVSNQQTQESATMPPPKKCCKLGSSANPSNAASSAFGERGPSMSCCRSKTEQNSPPAGSALNLSVAPEQPQGAGCCKQNPATKYNGISTSYSSGSGCCRSRPHQNGANGNTHPSGPASQSPASSIKSTNNLSEPEPASR